MNDRTEIKVTEYTMSAAARKRLIKFNLSLIKK